jgi:hypothetical protein
MNHNPIICFLILVVTLFIYAIETIMYRRNYRSYKTGSRQALSAQAKAAVDSVIEDVQNKVKMVTSTLNVDPVITFDDIKDSIQYVEGFKCKSGTHIGQRKLFLSEVQFLTNNIDNSPQYVVYAGAAPSNKGHMLSQLFPQVKFILVDPNRFDLIVNGVSHHKRYTPDIRYLKRAHKCGPAEYPTGVSADNYLSEITSSNHKIYLIEDYFTDELAELFAVLNPYFISDIRTNSEDEGEPDATDILWNMSMQFNWIMAIRPRAFMVKFRHPYYQNQLHFSELQMIAVEKSKQLGIDFISNYEAKKLEYLCGKIYLQAFPGQSSTETRLVGGPELDIIEHVGVSEYENKFFYYNVVERCFAHHKNKYANIELGFDHCNDCAIEAVVWENYVQKFDPSANVLDYVKILSTAVRRGLHMGVHGDFFTHNKSRINKLLCQCSYKLCVNID